MSGPLSRAPSRPWIVGMGALEEVTKLKNDLVAAHEAAELERVMDVLKALAAFEKIAR